MRLTDCVALERCLSLSSYMSSSNCERGVAEVDETDVKEWREAEDRTGEEAEEDVDGRELFIGGE